MLLLASVQEALLLVYSLVQGHGQEEKYCGALIVKEHVPVRRLSPDVGFEPNARKASCYVVGIVLQTLDDSNVVEQPNEVRAQG